MSKKPRISITERNQQTAAILDSDPRYRKGIASPFGLSSEQIRLKEPGWYCRWVNNAIITDKVWRSKNVGYDNVRPADLEDQEQLGMLQTDVAGHIVRGERGQEVLLKIPMPVYQERQLAKAKRNLADMKDSGRQTQSLLNAAADRYGAEAADYLDGRTKAFANIRTDREVIEVREDEE